MKTTKVCFYARVSTDVQDYTRQLEDIRTYCKGFNYEIIAEFSEKETGKNRKRPELTKLLKFCTENKDDLSFVLVSELSRLGRTGEVINTVEYLSSLGIGLISLKENLQTLNADKSVNHTSSLIMGILSSINTYELTTTKYRSRSGLLQSAKNGNWGGGNRLPYGYMREGKKLVVCPVESVIVKEIFEMYLSGKGTGQISTILNGRGVPTRTGVKWRDKVIYDIIQNPIYIGDRRFKGEILSAPSIIEKPIFNRVNEMRVSNYNKQGINSRYDYLLNDQLIKCGICGKSYFAHKRRNGNDNAYKCISIRYKENCGNTGISIDKLEHAVKFVFIKNFQDFIEPDYSKSAELSKENELYQAEYKRLSRELNKLVDLYTSDLITKSQFIEKQNDYKKKEKQLVEYIDDNNNRINELTRKVNYTGSSLKKVSKDKLKQVIKNIVITSDPLKITENKQDKTIKAEIKGYTGKSITIYLSQRAGFFLYNGESINFPLNL